MEEGADIDAMLEAKQTIKCKRCTHQNPEVRRLKKRSRKTHFCPFCYDKNNLTRKQVIKYWKISDKAYLLLTDQMELYKITPRTSYELENITPQPDQDIKPIHPRKRKLYPLSQAPATNTNNQQEERETQYANED